MSLWWSRVETGWLVSHGWGDATAEDLGYRRERERVDDHLVFVPSDPFDLSPCVVMGCAGIDWWVHAVHLCVWVRCTMIDENLIKFSLGIQLWRKLGKLTPTGVLIKGWTRLIFIVGWLPILTHTGHNHLQWSMIFPIDARVYTLEWEN